MGPILGTVAGAAHDQDFGPIQEPIQSSGIEQRIQEEIKKGPFLENKLKQYLIDNPHRVLFILKPDAALEGSQVEETRKQLKDRLEKMAKADLNRLEKDAEQLKALQESVEDVSVLPTLELEDVPPEMTWLT